MTSGRSLRIGEAILAVGVLMLGVLIAFETMRSVTSVGTVVGPALFPYLIAGGLVLVGLSLLRQAVVGYIAHEGGVELDGVAVTLVSPD
jgi:putative tricarboxylic transport membrane protein